MIVKLIILIISIWLGLRIYQTLQAKKQKKISSAHPQDMVRCETCKIHIPVNEAIKSGDKFFCRKDHLPKKD